MLEHLVKAAGVHHSQTTGFEQLVIAPGFLAYLGFTPLLFKLAGEATSGSEPVASLAIFAVAWFAGFVATARLCVSIARLLSTVGTFAFLVLVIWIQWQMRNALIGMLKETFADLWN